MTWDMSSNGYCRVTRSKGPPWDRFFERLPPRWRHRGGRTLLLVRSEGGPSERDDAGVRGVTDGFGSGVPS